MNLVAFARFTESVFPPRLSERPLHNRRLPLPVVWNVELESSLMSPTIAPPPYVEMFSENADDIVPLSRKIL